ncbi:MAG: hypothetical protein FJ102_19970 [Deltaproteobacteria bacterium]|nr:hypothetical protein [Deltaproteobacteria bacterium]
MQKCTWRRVCLLVGATVVSSGCPDQGLSTYNAEPEAEILSPGDGDAATEGQVVELRGQVTDDNDHALDLVATWFAGDQVICAGAPPDEEGLTSCTWTADLSGVALRLEVIDDKGAAGTDEVTLAVSPNEAPIAEILLPTEDGSYYVGTLVEFDGTAADADGEGGSLVLTWTSSLDGVLAIDSTLGTDGHSRGAVSLSEGQHYVEFSAVDAYGRGGTDTVVLTVGPPRQEPSAMLLEPGEGDVVSEGDTVTFEAIVSDGQDAPDALALQWSSDLDGVLSTAAADSTGRAAFTTSTLSRGTHTVTLLVSDTEGNSATEDVAFRVNGLPFAPELTLGPDGALTDDDLVAAIGTGSLDPDGDTVTYTWSWLRDGVASTESTSETLPASATTKGETWTVVLTPSDGLADGAPGRASLTVGNSLPEITGLGLSSTTPATNDVLIATAATADADGDTVDVSYQWFVGGLASATGARLDGADAFDKGDEVYVVAVPGDGEGTGDSRTSMVATVVNSAPGGATATISPASPYAGVDELVCAVSAADDDGDALSWTIEWTVDGVPFSGATTTYENGDTVPTGELAEAESWSCTATPSDGEDTGAATSDTVTIGACPYGEAESCPADSCGELVAMGYTADGRYWIDPDTLGAFEAYCDMSHDGGGWALVAVASDDGADTWTYTSRRYWDLDATTFGSLDDLDADYKSDALARVATTDVLVVHQPSGTWAAYAAVGDGSADLAAIIAGYGDEYCWRDGRGFEMTAGSLVASGGLCDTDLYLNAADHDGGGGSCSCADCVSHAYGPSWNIDNGDGCPFDDPGLMGSLGPSSDLGTESTAVGFGAALGLNTGASGAGENYAWILVR